MKEMERLQKHLSLIRNCMGWSAAKLGNELDVSRQMISNLENCRNQMTKIQYLAIRKILDDEIAGVPAENEMLSLVLKVLVDHPEEFSVEEREEVLSKAKMMAPAIMMKPSDRKTVSNAWKAVLAASGVIVSAALIAFIKSNDK